MKYVDEAVARDLSSVMKRISRVFEYERMVKRLMSGHVKLAKHASQRNEADFI